MSNVPESSDLTYFEEFIGDKQRCVERVLVDGRLQIDGLPLQALIIEQRGELGY